MKYIFYWDESFHTQKITGRNNTVNIYGDNQNDIYVSVYIGGDANQVNFLIDDYRVLEDEIKTLRGLSNDQELKGTSFRGKNFVHGIKTFNSDAFSFYTKFFEILNENKPKYHITFVSKTERLIEQCIRIKSDYISKERFYYSLIKFLYNYRYIPVMIEFFKKEQYSENELIDKIKNLLASVIEKTEGIPRKIEETNSLKELYLLLEKEVIACDAQIEYLWDYSLIYTGFNKYLDEIHINKCDCNLYMDRESSVHQSGLNYNYGKIEQVDSKEKIGVRIADILSNFLGRISYALQDDLKEKEIKDVNNFQSNDYKDKKILSKEWFELNSNQFTLYKSIAQYFRAPGNFYWSTYTGIYFDNAALFFSLFQYMNLYNTYDEFRRINSLMHSERFNKYVCEKIHERFTYM